MAVIQKTIRLIGSKGSESVPTIFDSGSTYSVILPAWAHRLDTVTPLPEPKKFGTTKDGETLSATERVTLDFEVDGNRLSDEFMLIPELSEPIIIGAATLRKWRIKSYSFTHSSCALASRQVSKKTANKLATCLPVYLCTPPLSPAISPPCLTIPLAD